MTEDQFNAAAFANPTIGLKDYKSMSNADVLATAQNRETLARFTWSPYMHNPKLRNRLHRIGVPTLFLWGAKDRIVSADYGRNYCAAVPGAQRMADNRRVARDLRARAVRIVWSGDVTGIPLTVPTSSAPREGRL